MKVKAFFIVIISFLLCAEVFAAQTPKNWLETKGKYLIETFNEKDLQIKHQKLDKILLEDIDIDYVSKFVMGKYYRQMNEEQKSRYKKAFRVYALDAYKKFPLAFGSGINFEVQDVFYDKNTIRAKTKISLNPESVFFVEFYLKPYGDTYKIVDLRIEETSLILSYRNRFNKMIADLDGEIDWFIEDLENIKKN